MKFTALWITGLIFAATSQHARANAILNGSFESTATFVDNAPVDDSMALNAGDTDLVSWNIVNGSLAWIGPANPYSVTASDGSYFLDLTGYETTGFAGVEQTIATQIGSTYLLTFDIGNDNVYNAPSGSAIWAIAGNNSVIFGNATAAQNSWLGAAMLFQAVSTSTTVSLLGYAGNAYIGLDNVSVTLISSPVPEPASIAMWGLGILSVVFAARKHRQMRVAR